MMITRGRLDLYTFSPSRCVRHELEDSYPMSLRVSTLTAGAGQLVPPLPGVLTRLSG